jgi:ABC-type multidrug transport system ATPase subunit
MGVVVRHLTHGAGQGTLHDLSFSWERGLLAVLGPPGAGKRTLLSLLAGVARPDKGEIEINGRPLKVAEASCSIGYVPPGAGLTPGLTVAEAFDFYLMLRRMHDPEERRVRIAATLEKFGLQGAADGPTSTIPPSIGYLVTIAQACLIEPDVLIIQEPTELTSEVRTYARAVLRNLAALRLILMASEDARGIEEYASSICVLERGRQRFFGTPAEVAATAMGHAWETELAAGQEPSFVYGFVATREESTPQGRRIRGVSRDAPAPQAKPATPDFFDGYTWCLATDDASVRSTQPSAVPAAEAPVVAAGGAG